MIGDNSSMEEIDIKEQNILDLCPELLVILLRDRTTQENLKWATDNYIKYGDGYYPDECITIEKITGINTNVIQPRVSKNEDEQIYRTRDKAEVFTASWICNKQNNLVDNEWFEQENVFNIELDEEWKTKTNKIIFPKGKKWQDYLLLNRMELSCGEAPYLVSRYDTVTGKKLSVDNRIGILDRKLRILNEHISYEKDWFTWAKKCFQSVYGYDYQGDNVLLARENLLYTFIETYQYKFGSLPKESQLLQIADVISWNIWQMDGITYNIPYSKQFVVEQVSLMGKCDKIIEKPMFAKIFDWKEKKVCIFKNIIREG